MCVVLKSDEGDEERFWGPDCLERTWEHMRTVKGTYCAHYGGGYDVPLLMNVHKFKRIVLTGTNILTAEEARNLKLRDTFPWWLNSLKKVGTAVGLEKMEVDRSQISSLTKQETLDYCARDVEIELRGVQASQAFLDENGADRAWTSGSSAVNLLRAWEPESWGLMRRFAIDAETVKVARSSVRGGRVECFARGRVKRVYSYDFKSSYPARYATSDLGVGIRPAKSWDKLGVWRCRWTWPHRSLVAPALDDVTQAGFGPCEAWLIDEEIAAFAEAGVKVEKGQGWAPQVCAPIGHTFARNMFAAKEGKGPSAFFSKVWLNSLHGKYGEDPVKESFTKDEPDPDSVYGDDAPKLEADTWWRYLEMKTDRDGRASPHAQPIAAAWILGRARVALWRALYAVQRAGGEVYYCDTDSVHCNLDPEQMRAALVGSGVEMGTSLGMLALEAGPCEGVYLGPKAYLLVDDKGAVIKSALKGVPLKALACGVLDGGQYREGRAKTDNPVEGRGVWARQRVTTRDLRRAVYADALTSPAGAVVLKDGVTSFLRGLNGVVGKTGKKEPATWQRHQHTRRIKPCGRGKAYAASTRWRYLSTIEMTTAMSLSRLPESVTRWEARPPEVIDYAERAGLVARHETPRSVRDAAITQWVDLTPRGKLWLRAANQMDDEPAEDDDTLEA